LGRLAVHLAQGEEASQRIERVDLLGELGAFDRKKLKRAELLQMSLEPAKPVSAMPTNEMMLELRKAQEARKTGGTMPAVESTEEHTQRLRAKLKHVEPVVERHGDIVGRVVEKSSQQPPSVPEIAELEEQQQPTTP
jgi:hypothetical protein